MSDGTTCAYCGEKLGHDLDCPIRKEYREVSDGKKDHAERHCGTCGKSLVFTTYDGWHCDNAACLEDGRKKDPYKEVSTTFSQRLENMAVADARVLVEKGRSYGDSWRKRGGNQAFAVLARKWDRIENIATWEDYDIFECWRTNKGDIIDDIQDLRRYLMLVEEYMTRE